MSYDPLAAFGVTEKKPEKKPSYDPLAAFGVAASEKKKIHNVVLKDIPDEILDVLIDTWNHPYFEEPMEGMPDKRPKGYEKKTIKVPIDVWEHAVRRAEEEKELESESNNGSKSNKKSNEESQSDEESSQKQEKKQEEKRQESLQDEEKDETPKEPTEGSIEEEKIDEAEEQKDKEEENEDQQESESGEIEREDVEREGVDIDIDEILNVLDVKLDEEQFNLLSEIWNTYIDQELGSPNIKTVRNYLSCMKMTIAEIKDKANVFDRDGCHKQWIQLEKVILKKIADSKKELKLLEATPLELPSPNDQSENAKLIREHMSLSLDIAEKLQGKKFSGRYENIELDPDNSENKRMAKLMEGAAKNDKEAFKKMKDLIQLVINNPLTKEELNNVIETAQYEVDLAESLWDEMKNPVRSRWKLLFTPVGQVLMQKEEPLTLSDCLLDWLISNWKKSFNQDDTADLGDLAQKYIEYIEIDSEKDSFIEDIEEIAGVNVELDDCNDLEKDYPQVLNIVYQIFVNDKFGLLSKFGKVIWNKLLEDTDEKELSDEEEDLDEDLEKQIRVYKDLVQKFLKQGDLPRNETDWKGLGAKIIKEVFAQSVGSKSQEKSGSSSSSKGSAKKELELPPPALDQKGVSKSQEKSNSSSSSEQNAEKGLPPALETLCIENPHSKAKNVPRFDADKCQNMLKTGNDGREYKSELNTKGNWSWILIQRDEEPAPKKKKPTRIQTMKQRVQDDDGPSQEQNEPREVFDSKECGTNMWKKYFSILNESEQTKAKTFMETWWEPLAARYQDCKKIEIRLRILAAASGIIQLS